MKDPKTLPFEPGVYLFKNAQGEVIYVGKAKSLRSRVSSYFNKEVKSPKTQLLVKNIADIDFIVVLSEIEALLLENKLIKQHSPKYNVTFKDGKTFAYLQITDEPYPRLLSTRRISKKGEYFGPYTDGFARRDLQQLSIKLFQLRVCKKLPKKACLNYHIGLCTAPCIGAVSKEHYRQQVSSAKLFLRGDSKQIVSQLKTDMKQLSSEMKFEQALEKKRHLEAIELLKQRQAVDRIERYDQDVVVLQEFGTRAIVELFSIKKGVISSRKEYRFESQEELFESFVKLYYSQHPIPREIITNITLEDSTAIEAYLAHLRQGPVALTVPERGEKRKLVEIALKNIRPEDARLTELQASLNLVALPRIIECFDISNLGGSSIVAGMVRFVDGREDKSGYRRFELHVGAQDDFASMAEVVHRRYHRLQQENSELPHLIIIDGGVGQLNAALHSLRSLGLSIPIIALAKEQEEIFLPHQQEPLRFDAHSPMMLYLRRIRDAVHRFALSYHRKKRSMNQNINQE